MAGEIHLTIDGKAAAAAPGSTILEAAESLGIEIPTLCHFKGIEPFTSCFLCVVEVEGAKNPVPSCATKVREGMAVRTQSETLRLLRRMCLELLMSDHCGDCVAPCSLTCPAGVPVQQFVNAIASGKNAEALRLLKEALPLPGSLGRICPRPCESQCRRLALEEAVSICMLHRYAADADAQNGAVWVPPPGPATGKRVAVIGAGPAGMAAAYFLRLTGHAVEIFESKPEPGGMLRWGIPAYRLPRETLALELSAILGMGVKIHYNTALGRDFHIADLKQKGFDAVFLALGAPYSAALKIPGENLPAVFGGVEFLGRVAAGEHVNVGKRVIVIGGGNTAIDAVRTARRLGAAEVTLLYRRTRAEMPALAAEVDAAEHEGVAFHFLAAPLEIKPSEQAGLRLRCQQMKLGEPGPDGRRKPEPVPGADFELEADCIIAAIGQRIDAELLRQEGLELAKNGNRLTVNPKTMQTSLPYMFAGGDMAAEEKDRIAVWAVRTGRFAATAIDQFLAGRPVVGMPAAFTTVMAASPKDVPPSRLAGFEKRPRAKIRELPPAERTTHFGEVEEGLAPDAAVNEAQRCLACGCGAAEDCKLRRYAKEYGATPDRFKGASRDYSIDMSVPGLAFESGKCITCGLCVRISALYGKEGLFGFVHRGFNTRIKPYHGLAGSETAAKIIQTSAEACPTGAIMTREELEKRFLSCLAPHRQNDNPM